MSADWLQLFDVGWLGPFLSAFLSVMILSWFRRMLRGGNSFESVETGSIRISRTFSVGLSIISALLATMGIVLALLAPEDPLALILGLFLAAMFIAMTLYTLLFLSPHYALVWDFHGVEGPAKEYTIKWKVPRNRIAWDELNEVETKKNGTVCLSASPGSKIYYSHYFENHGLFEATVRSRRPDLFI